MVVPLINVLTVQLNKSRA